MSRAGREPPPPALQADALPKELSRQLISWLFGASTWSSSTTTFGPLHYKKLPIHSLPSAWNETGDFRYQRNAFTYHVALREFLTAQAGFELPG
jgi:hypothetical protein